MAMNKSDLVDKVHEYLDGTKVQADGVVQLIVDEIHRSLKKGEDVSIAGLGIFKVRRRKARKARNPRTGEEIQVPAMNVPKFKAAKALKDTVRGE